MMSIVLDGPGQLSPAALKFIEFMRDVCDDQVDDMTNALNTVTLRDRRNRAIHRDASTQWRAPVCPQYWLYSYKAACRRAT
jgi:hypothetical protein